MPGIIGSTGWAESAPPCPGYPIRLVNWFMSKWSRQALILPLLSSKVPMTGSGKLFQDQGARTTAA